MKTQRSALHCQDIWARLLRLLLLVEPPWNIEGLADRHRGTGAVHRRSMMAVLYLGNEVAVAEISQRRVIGRKRHVARLQMLPHPPSATSDVVTCLRPRVTGSSLRARRRVCPISR